MDNHWALKRRMFFFQTSLFFLLYKKETCQFSLIFFWHCCHYIYNFPQHSSSDSFFTSNFACDARRGCFTRHNLIMLPPMLADLKKTYFDHNNQGDFSFSMFQIVRCTLAPINRQINIQ